ncbi:DNA binding domain, excisionase family [Enterococcus faecalis 13-SD-W-01]|nr:DNA binding domain, excisionase family [Enterococcus faecalis 13-SD-W-01]
MTNLALVDLDDLREILREASSISSTAEADVWFTKEAAAFLRTSPTEVDEMASRGELPGRRIKGRWRFSSVALNEWLEYRKSEEADK